MNEKKVEGKDQPEVEDFSVTGKQAVEEKKIFDNEKLTENEEQNVKPVSEKLQKIKTDSDQGSQDSGQEHREIENDPLLTSDNQTHLSTESENKKTNIKPLKKSIATKVPEDEIGTNKPEESETVILSKKTNRNSTERRHSLTQQSPRVKKKDIASPDSHFRPIGPGTILKDRFDLLEEIGAGGMGVVYKALDRRDVEAGNSSFIAIKVLHEEYKTNPDVLKALHSETRKTQQLAHPNIITVYDFDRDGDAVFMTMEYIEGIPLNQVIKSNPKGLRLAEALEIIEQLGKALAYAHSHHVIHSDFKPGNIFIARNNHAKVLDFGIARLANMARVREFDAGILGGMTPTYASLEMIRGEFPDPRDDVYALACVAYELLSGKHPYNRENAEQAYRKNLHPKTIKSLNGGQWKALKKALAFHRAERSGSIDEMIKGLHSKSSAPIYYFILIGCIGLVAILWIADLITEEQQQVVEEQASISQDSETVVVDDKPGTGVIESRVQDTKLEDEITDTSVNISTPVDTAVEPKTEDRKTVLESDDSLAVEEEQIKIRTEQKEYLLGEQLQVEFTVEEPLYVRVVVINSIGEVFKIFPNPYQKDNFSSPGIVYQIPPLDSKLTIMITGPKGRDKVLAVGAKEPFPADVLTFSEAGKLIVNHEGAEFKVAEIDYIIK